jgi:hypothetical protein
MCLSIGALAQSRFGVLPSDLGDGVGPELAASVDAALATRLQQAGHAVLPGAQILSHLKRHADLRGCTHADCLDRLAEIAQAARLAGAQARRQGKDLEVRVWIYDPAVHASVTGQAACTTCGPERLGALATAALDRALATDARRFQPVTLAVASHPAGATIALDGRPAGVTPLRLRISPGSHEVAVSLEGYRTQTRDLEAEGGQDLEIDFPLAPAEPVRRLSPALKWLAWGGAAVALAAGGWLVARDGDDAGGGGGAVEGRETHASGTEGVVWIGVGVVLGATGATLWAFE